MSVLFTKTTTEFISPEIKLTFLAESGREPDFYKKMATDIAEKYEKTDRHIKHLENTIKEKDVENDKLDSRFEEFEIRIGKLNTEKQELVVEFETVEAEKVELSKTIEDLKITIQSIEGTIEAQQKELIE